MTSEQLNPNQILATRLKTGQIEKRPDGKFYYMDGDICKEFEASEVEAAIGLIQAEDERTEEARQARAADIKSKRKKTRGYLVRGGITATALIGVIAAGAKMLQDQANNGFSEATLPTPLPIPTKESTPTVTVTFTPEPTSTAQPTQTPQPPETPRLTKRQIQAATLVAKRMATAEAKQNPNMANTAADIPVGGDSWKNYSIGQFVESNAICLGVFATIATIAGVGVGTSMLRSKSE